MTEPTVRDSDPRAPGDGSRNTGLVAALALVLLMGLAGIGFLATRTPSSLQPAASPPQPPGPETGEMPPVSAAFTEELASLEARLAEAPADTVALARMASLLRMAHQPQRGLEYAQRWAELLPTSVPAHRELLAAFAAVALWDDAYDANLKLMEWEPGEGAHLLNMGVIELNRGDTESARRWWARTVEEFPGTDVANRAAAALADLDIREG